MCYLAENYGIYSLEEKAGLKHYITGTLEKCSQVLFFKKNFNQIIITLQYCDFFFFFFFFAMGIDVSSPS